MSYIPLGTKLGMGKEGRFHSELHTSWYQAGYGQGGEVSQCELHTSWCQAGYGQGGEVSQCTYMQCCIIATPRAQVVLFGSTNYDAEV